MIDTTAFNTPDEVGVPISRERAEQLHQLVLARRLAIQQHRDRGESMPWDGDPEDHHPLADAEQVIVKNGRLAEKGRLA